GGSRPSLHWPCWCFSLFFSRTGKSKIKSSKNRTMRKIAMLGSGFIGRLYADSLVGLLSKDQIVSVYSRTEASARIFAEYYNVSHYTSDLKESINHEEVDTFIISLPILLHEEAGM